MSLKPNTNIKYIYLLNPYSVEKTPQLPKDVDYKSIFDEEVNAYHKRVKEGDLSFLYNEDYKLRIVNHKATILHYMNKASDQFELDVQTDLEQQMKEIEEENRNKRFDPDYRQKNPNNINREYHLSWHVKIKKVGGVIFPVSTHDYSDVSNFIDNINNSYLQEQITKKIDKEMNREKCWGVPNTDEINEIKSDQFYNMFKIPIFEAHKTIPGYRFNNAPVGKTESLELKSAYIEAGFRAWLQKNLK